MRVENSFIPVYGVGETTEQRLWEAGITTWDSFDGSVVGPKTTDRIRTFIDTATERLRRADTTFFDETFPSRSQWRLYETFRDHACFLDIETTGLSTRRATTTVVSLRRDEETTSLVRGLNLTAERLAEELEEAKVLVSYNGKQFDLPILSREFGVDPSVPHIDLRFACRRLGLTGGLKSVERELDLHRSLSDVDGREAVRLWRRYQGGNVGALETLVEYNREDTRQLEPIMDVVASRLHERVFESIVRGEA